MIHELLFLIFPAIPSLRARDCSKNEKEALNYLFLVIPLLNVLIPFFLKSFAVVWSADTVAFFAMYAWKVFICIIPSFCHQHQTQAGSDCSSFFLPLLIELETDGLDTNNR